MFLHAFRLAAATAMMCGHPSAQARFSEFTDLMESVAPPFWKMLHSEEEFQEIGLALMKCQTWCVYIKQRYKSTYRYEGWLAEGTIALKIDSKEWEFTKTFNDGYTEESPEFKEIAEFFEQLAPLEATRIIEKYEPEEVK